MAWALLRTNYKDAAWEGMRKFQLTNNPDGTISLTDVTVYTVKQEAFFGAVDINRTNEAINAIMRALEDGTDLYDVFMNFFNDQKVLFQDRADADIDTLKSDYAIAIASFMNTQESDFNAWFDQIKGQLDTDAAGSLQNQINIHEDRIDRLDDIIDTTQLTFNLCTKNGDKLIAKQNGYILAKDSFVRASALYQAISELKEYIANNVVHWSDVTQRVDGRSDAVPSSHAVYFR